MASVSNCCLQRSESTYGFCKIRLYLKGLFQVVGGEEGLLQYGETLTRVSKVRQKEFFFSGEG